LTTLHIPLFIHLHVPCRQNQVLSSSEVRWTDKRDEIKVKWEKSMRRGEKDEKRSRAHSSHLRVSSHLISEYHLIIIISSHHIISHLISSHHTISSHLITSHLISSHLISSRMIQSSHLSPLGLMFFSFLLRIVSHSIPSPKPSACHMEPPHVTLHHTAHT
jgi:hypothetical protein